MKKLIITGASGFLGWNLCNLAKGSWDVKGICFSHESKDSPQTLVSMDLCNFAGIDELFETYRPDAIVHAAAAADPNFCQRNAELSRKINIDVSEHIAGLSKTYGAACAFISTDLVFDGKKPPYSESCQVHPVSMYGAQKAEAEQRTLEVNPNVLICRMPLMYGDAPVYAKNHLLSLIENIIAGNECNLFVDEFRTVVSGADAAWGILRFIGTQSGILHLGGQKPTSRYDFGRAVAKALCKSDSCLKPCFQKDIIMAAPRPPDVSLDSSRAFLLGWRPDPIEVALGKLECIRKYAS